ncbi:hypothetical protein Ancab_004712, partial [Ancistrocladus abbreviatus]
GGLNLEENLKALSPNCRKSPLGGCGLGDIHWSDQSCPASVRLNAPTCNALYGSTDAFERTQEEIFSLS